MDRFFHIGYWPPIFFFLSSWTTYKIYIYFLPHFRLISGQAWLLLNMQLLGKAPEAFDGGNKNNNNGIGSNNNMAAEKSSYVVIEPVFDGDLQRNCPCCFLISKQAASSRTLKFVLISMLLLEIAFIYWKRIGIGKVYRIGI